MATYYVRRSGNDASAGTSAGAAWRTIAKLLATIASGDTGYIGAGVYRETCTLATAMAAETFIIGDVDGSHTGDAGEVRWSNWSTDFGGDRIPGSTAPCLALGSSKNHYTFQNICFYGSGATNSCCIDGTAATLGTNFTFRNCSFFALGITPPIQFTGVFATNHAIWFDQCRVLNLGTAGGVRFLGAKGTGSDYDTGLKFTNCLIDTHGTAAIILASTGAGVNLPGGVVIQSCTLFCNTACVQLTTLAYSTSIPSTITDSCCIGGATATLVGGTSGQLTEDYNTLNNQSGSVRSNVAVGAHTVAGEAVLIHFGQEDVWGGQYRPYGMPAEGSALLGIGGAASPTPQTVDLLGAPRPSGTTRIIASGTATSGAAKTLTDTGAAFPDCCSFTVKIISGTGSGQVKTIKTCTATVLTVYGNWTTNPDNTSVYVIYSGCPVEGFTCTSGSTTTAVQSSALWYTVGNQWAGYTLEVISGTGSGQTTTCTANNATTLTLVTLGTGLDNTSVVVLYRKTSINAVNQAAGAFERSNSGVREATTVDASTYALKLAGYGYQDFQIPVDAAATTITVRVQYDAQHASTNKPQATLLANPEIGVTTETKTATGGSAGVWETLTFSAFTPTVKGVVTIRVLARAANAPGSAFFDTFAVSA